MTAVPNRRDLTVAMSRLRDREVLTASEAITAIQTLVLPLLRTAGHGTTDLILYAGQGAVESARGELGRFIRLMERSTIALVATVDSHNPARVEELCRSAALIELMRLLAEMRIHMDISVV